MLNQLRSLKEQKQKNCARGDVSEGYSNGKQLPSRKHRCPKNVDYAGLTCSSVVLFLRQKRQTSQTDDCNQRVPKGVPFGRKIFTIPLFFPPVPLLQQCLTSTSASAASARDPAGKKGTAVAARSCSSEWKCCD